MPLLWSVLGGSLFGLAARFGQLGIQHRNLFENPGGHAISALVFGYAGYWAYRWDIRAQELLTMKRAEIEENRRRQLGVIKRLAEESKEAEEH